MIPDEIEKLKFAALNCPSFGADVMQIKVSLHCPYPGQQGFDSQGRRSSRHFQFTLRGARHCAAISGGTGL